MSNPLVKELESRFLPQLEAMASQLRRDFPRVCIDTWSSTIGSATTDNPAHCLGIDCSFSNAPAGKADNLAFYIEVLQINSNPYLADLSVKWGEGDSADCIETDLLESPIPWSEDTIARIESALPRLFEVLVEALHHPPFPNARA